MSLSLLIWVLESLVNLTPSSNEWIAAAAAKSLQSCPTLCDPIDGSPPGSPIPGILQTRTLEWVAISFSNAWKWKVKVKLLSHVRPSASPWTAAFQAPPSTGFSRQVYWSGVPFLYNNQDQREVWCSLPRWASFGWSVICEASQDKVPLGRVGCPPMT